MIWIIGVGCLFIGYYVGAKHTVYRIQKRMAQPEYQQRLNRIFSETFAGVINQQTEERKKAMVN